MAIATPVVRVVCVCIVTVLCGFLKMTLICQNLRDKIKAIKMVGMLLLFSQTKPGIRTKSCVLNILIRNYSGKQSQTFRTVIFAVFIFDKH